MDDQQGDRTRALMLDGNAVAGRLYDVFGVEMTASPTACAHCGWVGAMGALWAFTQAPGVVLRCPACEQVILRMVETAEVIYLDARGATYLRLARRSA